MRYKSNNHRETENIAKSFAGELIQGDVVCLRGDLGVGKTAFVKGMAEGLGVDEYISSPTFTIVNCYDGKYPVYHFDAYRISDSEEMYEIGFEEFIYGKGISIIEWPEMIEDILPENRYEVNIKKDLSQHDNFREITIERRNGV